MTPDLSLIVPCYNEARHLRENVGAVVEVLELTSLSWEIVFVDDGSEDETRAIIRELCAADARCRSIFHDGNRGRGAAFKTGFAAFGGARHRVSRHRSRGARALHPQPGERDRAARRRRRHRAPPLPAAADQGLAPDGAVLGLPAAVRRLAVAGSRGQRDRLQVLQTRDGRRTWCWPARTTAGSGTPR